MVRLVCGVFFGAAFLGVGLGIRWLIGLGLGAVWASSDEGLAPLVKPKLSREFGMVSLLMRASMGKVAGPVSLR